MNMEYRPPMKGVGVKKEEKGKKVTHVEVPSDDPMIKKFEVKGDFLKNGYR